MLSVRLPVNSTLLVIKFLGSQKFSVDFRLGGWSAPLPPALYQVNCIHFPPTITENHAELLLPEQERFCLGDNPALPPSRQDLPGPHLREEPGPPSAVRELNAGAHRHTCDQN